MPTTLAACTECGTEFHARASAAYCSAACRQRAYRRKRNAGAGRNVPAPATIGSLISALNAITCELEKHTADMNYAGTDEFNVHTFHRHPFDGNAYEVLHGLTERIEGVSNDLCRRDGARRAGERGAERGMGAGSDSPGDGVGSIAVGSDCAWLLR
jgi:hypothetical protein